MIEIFSKNKSTLPAIYQNIEQNNNDDVARIRIAPFPFYNAGESMCYKPNKPISKMIDYEKFNI